ncbi:hypothetical protein AMTRI_Chr13g85490 [Amborella trichopoda]
MNSSSSGWISIAASAKKLDVDNTISLRYYYRIADNLLKQAEIYREEKNLVDLYIMLLRFSSLVSETIPCHKDYHVLLQKEKSFYMQKLLKTLNELEKLKPVVQQQVEVLNKKHASKGVRQGHVQHNDSLDSSLEWPPVKKPNRTNYEIMPVYRGNRQDGALHTSWKNNEFNRNSFSNSKQIIEPLRKMSLNVPLPKEETLSRHSILGPNGLHGQWQAPFSDRGVQYPRNLDLTPIEIPSPSQTGQDGVMIRDGTGSTLHSSTIESVLSLDDGRGFLHSEEPCPISMANTLEVPVKFDIIRQPSPPPVLADVQDLIPPAPPQVIDSRIGLAKPSQEELVQSESPLQLHVCLQSVTMMEEFMRLAKSNTQKNLETCGVLAGSLKNRKFFITALIIPKQESTSDSCQTMNEEEIYEVQDTRSLFPLGWIHTHPSQSCFMSSIDLHTHYSYQIMLPEAIAIVMAPTDTSRKHGIFRLTDPGGITVIRECQQRGFHPHDEPSDGSPIYDHCTHVYMNPTLKFEVIDLR